MRAQKTSEGGWGGRWQLIGEGKKTTHAFELDFEAVLKKKTDRNEYILD